MSGVSELFDLVGGGPVPAESEGAARRWQLVLRASLAAVLFGAVFGVAAGSTDPTLAATNVLKVPMVVLLSTLCALPAGLLVWKLTGAPNRASDLLMGVAAGNFTATLVLAALSPLIALYYHSSAFMGAPLAMAVVTLAVGVGLFNAARAVMSRRPEGVEPRRLALPVGVLVVTQLAALLQFIHIASPILPEVTVFDGGVDAMVDR